LIVCQAAIAPVAHRINARRIPLLLAFSGDAVVTGMVESATDNQGSNRD
jgi:hypothetical protein